MCQIAQAPRLRGHPQPVQNSLPAGFYESRWEKVGSPQPVELESDGGWGLGEGLECEPRFAKPNVKLTVDGDAVRQGLGDGRIFKQPAPGGSLLLAPEALEQIIQGLEPLAFAGCKREDMHSLGITHSREETHISISFCGLFYFVSDDMQMA